MDDEVEGSPAPPTSDASDPETLEPDLVDLDTVPLTTVAPEFFDTLERAILGETRQFTRLDVARESGVPVERLEALWRSLGFTAPESDSDVLFMNADVEAVQLLDELVGLGMIDQESELAVARSMGRSFARLAEWEIGEIATGLGVTASDLDEATVEGLVSQLLPVVERLQNYAWRRHLTNAAGRMMLQPGAGENGVPMAVGFADIVGFTRSSRRMTGDELGDLVETFESTVSTVIAGHGGRVIKTIGDEVLYVADDPIVAARISLELAEGHDTDEHFPEVRVGVAYGEVLSRLGDVFGEVVNIASRLTSLARPARVLMNRELADLLVDLDDEFRVRRARTAAVKGYSRLETWSLKRPKQEATRLGFPV
jgi:adenylate cyclase